MNLHAPERGPQESFTDYKRRRKLSHQVNQLNGKPEKWTPTPRLFGSMATSAVLDALLSGAPLPGKKRK